MKTILILISVILIPLELISQNINGKLGTGGQFIIRDTNNTFLTVPQNTGYLTLNRSLTLPNTTSSALGNIFKGTDRFLHNYQVSGTDGLNTFLGINSGNFTMSGSINYHASFNTAVGSGSLSSNTTGYQNVAMGYFSLSSNNSGFSNVGIGVGSLYTNITGQYNTAVGQTSLLNNTGNTNTALGYNTGSNITTGSNNTAIGNSAQVPSNTGSNQVRIGNASVTYAGVQVAWTITSDSRWKDNITGLKLGLGFISKLNPVSYTRKNDETHKMEYGFIAQEVEEVLKQNGVTNSGMLNIDDEGRYELRYNDLLAPMVKAIQELKAENDELKDKLSKFEQIQNILAVEIDKLKSKDKEYKEVKLGEK